LIESKGNSSLEYLIIGVGLNVNQIDFGTLQSKATSMKLERGKAYTIKQVLKDFIDIYSKIEPNLEEYVKHSIIIGKTITLNKEVYVVNGITVNGSLILKQNETTIEMKLNEISFEEIYNEFNN